MPISLLNRIIITLKPPDFSLVTRITLSSTAEKYCTHLLNHTLSSTAEKYCTHLLNHPQNPEKTLIQISPNLDAKSVSEVLKRFSTEKPELGLRFFIWAGVNSKEYRHSRYMYSMACDFFHISRNPGRIRGLFDGYKKEGCVVSVKLFKVVLNLCKEGKFCDEALWVLRKMKEFNCTPDTTVYNVVIGLFCEKGEVDVGIELMREMELSGLCYDMITYMAVLKGFCNGGRLEEACLLFRKMEDNGCDVNLVAYSVLLDGLCRFRQFDKAFELLGEMENKGLECAPNVITYTSVIQSLCENGKLMDALSILDRMESFNCSPNRVTISVLVKGLCVEGCIDEAYRLVDRVGGEGISVASGECYSCLVTSLLNVERFEEAEKLFRWMLSNDLRPDGAACSMLLRKLCEKRRFVDAFHLVEEVVNKGVVVTIDSDIYSVILDGLREQMNVAEVEKLSNLMSARRIQVQNPVVKGVGF